MVGLFIQKTTPFLGFGRRLFPHVSCYCFGKGVEHEPTYERADCLFE